MTLLLDPVASLEHNTLIFRNQARKECEIAPHLGRLLPTGGYLFSQQVQERLAQIIGLTFAQILPSGSAPPRISVTTDRQINLCTQHSNPDEAARMFAAHLWRCGHASQIKTKSLGQLEVCINRLPVRIRFTPDRRALLRYLHQRFEGRKTQLATLADRCG